MLKALDGDTILGEKDFVWEVNHTYVLKMQVSGNRIQAWVDDQLQFDVSDEGILLSGGAVAYTVDLGNITSQAMTVKPIGS